MKKSVLTKSVRRFFQTPRTARLATIGADGYPHIVPIWFTLDGDDIIFGSDDNERKVWNARRNPKGAVAVGGDPETDNAGYMIQGDLTVEEHPKPELIHALDDFYSSDEEEETENHWTEGDKVIIRLKPRRVIRVW